LKNIKKDFDVVKKDMDALMDVMERCVFIYYGRYVSKKDALKDVMERCV